MHIAAQHMSSPTLEKLDLWNFCQSDLEHKAPPYLSSKPIASALGSVDLPRVGLEVENQDAMDSMVDSHQLRGPFVPGPRVNGGVMDLDTVTIDK
ncbi:hypothetical protein AJ78_06715 [Emergomyces pasteurianus Ep9510]|uniref:Uncharacterized protein n=1 Tax=Emergomyces pasteurianus Ep9510 TaxID=1447872 RepID=A0A1J9P7X4_9EURO|nr:hypothetical protein AJ78_06715 [Emergomyces pasteurianus Ep9510]